MKKKIISFSAIVPFVLPLVALFFLVGLPLLTFGILREDLTEAIKLASILILIPYSFLVLAVLQQTRLAYVDIVNDKELVYKDTIFASPQKIQIADIKKVEMKLGYDKTYGTDETITFFNSKGEKLLAMDVEKLNGEVIADILASLKKLGSDIQFDKVSSDFLKEFEVKLNDVV